MSAAPQREIWTDEQDTEFKAIVHEYLKGDISLDEAMRQIKEFDKKLDSLLAPTTEMEGEKHE